MSSFFKDKSPQLHHCEKSQLIKAEISFFFLRDHFHNYFIAVQSAAAAGIRHSNRHIFIHLNLCVIVGGGSRKRKNGSEAKRHFNCPSGQRDIFAAGQLSILTTLPFIVVRITANRGPLFAFYTLWSRSLKSAFDQL